jgi:hypothetical protein
MAEDHPEDGAEAEVVDGVEEAAEDGAAEGEGVSVAVEDRSPICN